MNIRWVRIFTLVCAVVLGNIDNTAKGNTDDCLISSKKSTITRYSKEGTLQERIVIKNNKVTIIRQQRQNKEPCSHQRREDNGV